MREAEDGWGGVKEKFGLQFFFFCESAEGVFLSALN